MNQDKAPTDSVPRPSSTANPPLPPFDGPRIVMFGGPMKDGSFFIGDLDNVQTDIHSTTECMGIALDLPEHLGRLGKLLEDMKDAAARGDVRAYATMQLEAVKLHGWASALGERLQRNLTSLEENGFYLHPLETRKAE